MAWLRARPKQASSIKTTFVELKQAVEALKAKRQDVMDNEVSLEYPRESRVNMYKQQLSSLDKVLSLLNKAVDEMEDYPKEEDNVSWL